MGYVCECICVALSYILLVITAPLTILFTFKSVKEYERVVIFRLGRLKLSGSRGPGLVFILPCTDDYRLMDLRVVSFDVPPQEILTKDSVTIYVDAVIYYKIIEPVKAVLKIENYSTSTQTLGATTLRNIIGTKNLSEILLDRESISLSMQVTLDEVTIQWGVKVDRVEIKDVSLPLSMQRAMAAEGEATREARAKVVAAEGELKASKALKEASDVIAQNPVALQLRYLQTLNTVSSERSETTIFPLPMDIIRHMMAMNRTTST